MKLGRCIKELERIYGFREGRPEKLSNNFTVNNQPTNESELAEQLGITQQTIQNYKKLSEMIPELEDLVDTGIVTKTTTLAIIKNLSTDGQRELISHLETPCYIYLYDYSIIKDYTG